MSRHSFRIRLLAFFLLLIFAQKAGIGMCLHNIFHGNTAKAEKHNGNKALSFDCSCKEDLSMPFLESSTPEYTTPLLHNITYSILPLTAVSDNSPLGLFLRGPPAWLA